jgi:hypothetical protein
MVRFLRLPNLCFAIGTDVNGVLLKDCTVGCKVSSILPRSLNGLQSLIKRTLRSRRYYYVQISTGESTWDTPTTAAPQVPSPGTTPANQSPYAVPGEGTRGMEGQEGDRSLGVGWVHTLLHPWTIELMRIQPRARF